MTTEAPIESAQTALTPAENRHLRSLEGKIERGLQTFREVGLALLEIRDSKLYRMNFATFEAYCRERWQIGRDRAYQIMGAAEVANLLGDDAPANEAQASELVTVMHADPEAVKEVWKEVKATGKPVTAEVIREVVRAHSRPGQPTEQTATEALIARVLGLAGAYKRWATTSPTRKEKAAVNAAFEKLEEVTGG